MCVCVCVFWWGGGGWGGVIFKIIGREESLKWGDLAFYGVLDNHLETMLYYRTLTDYLYVPNNLKDIKDRLYAYMASSKLFSN